MPASRSAREVPLRFDDDFRSGVASAISLPFLVIPLVVTGGEETLEPLALLVGACLVFTVFSVVFVGWTHLLFTRTDAARLARIAERQGGQRRSAVSRWFGSGGTVSVTMSVAAGALVVAVAAAVLGSGAGGVWLPVLVLLTVASSWTTMVYAWALRYLRLHASGDTIGFEIEGEPSFSDFISMAAMVSSMGALSAGIPRTRAGLTAVRTHSLIAFAFNALIVAMTVSVLGSLIAAA